MPSFLTLQAPAKINLCLHILGRREDGYHNLSMIMEKVSLCDEIALASIPSGIELVTSHESRVTSHPEKNLCFRTAKVVQEVSETSCGVRIQLNKNIPMGGGLGGGSSDAAAVLKGLNELWELHWPLFKLAELGVKLGADIPFFLEDGPARVEGIGDKITPLRNFPKLWIILVNPGIHLSTPWAYQAWDAAQSLNSLTPKNQSVTSPSTFAELLQVLHNDFEAVVFPKYPEIGHAKEMLLNVGACGVLMSGSGSSVFGLFETKEERDKAIGRLEVAPRWKVYAVEN